MSTLLLLLLTGLAHAEAPAPAETPAPPSDAPESASPEDSEAGSPGMLEIDCRVPAEILVDGVKLAQLYFPGVTSFEVGPGTHQLRIYTNGVPTDLVLPVISDQTQRVLVGRTGVSAEDPSTSEVDPDAIVPVEFRAVGGVGSQVRVGNARHVVSAGGSVSVELPTGQHALSVRSPDGTVIWATGRLDVRGSDTIYVQIAEGRLPEVTGRGAFLPDAGG